MAVVVVVEVVVVVVVVAVAAAAAVVVGWVGTAPSSRHAEVIVRGSGEYGAASRGAVGSLG